MKILIAGFGSIGRRHFNNLLALGERDIVFYRTHRSTLPEDETANFPIETDLQAALAHRPQAVIISNPTALHLEVAIPAARAGCCLMVEKPVSHTVERLDELAAALQSSGSRMLVGYHFRFHPGLQRIRHILEEGGIGRPLSVRAHWGEYLPAWHPWEDYRQGYSARKDLGGGVILTLSHPLDYLRWLFGEVSAIWAFCGELNNLALDVEDTAEIGLRFKTGLLGSLHLDYNQRPPSHHLEVIGTEGTLQWDNSTGSVRHFQAAAGEWREELPPPGFERNTLFLDELRHFLQVCRGQAEPLCTLEDGRQALRLGLAAQASQEHGQLIHL
jgi:predicted dehydrogenase